MAMKIGLAQIDCAVGDVSANCTKIDSFAQEAAAKNCSVIIFPEMTDTGYVTDVIQETAQPWPGEPFKVAAKSAKQNSLYLICGLSEREGESIFNSIAAFSPAGELIQKYRKTHLFSPAPVHEDRCFTSGTEFNLVEIENSKWGLSICYDLRFPEIYRYLTLQGAQILLNCSAWPAMRPKHWEYLTRSRAIENQAFFVGVDRVGKDGELTFNGHSRVIDPFGEIVAEGSADTEELVIGEIDLEKVLSFRKAIPALQTRRSDLYGNLNTKLP